MQVLGQSGLRGRMLAIGSGAVVAAAMTATIAAAGLSSGEPSTAGGSAWQFSIQAGGGTIERAGKGEFDVRLDGVNRNVLAFQDRPGRGQESVSLRRLLERLGLGRHQVDPPNGVISADTGRGEQQQMGVEILRGAYNPRKDRLDLRVRRLEDENDPRPGIGLLPRRFGSTSVFVDGAGNSCTAAVDNGTDASGTLVSASKWSTDDWNGEPQASFGGGVNWQSNGGLFRGCSNTVVYQLNNGDQMTVVTTYKWNDSPDTSCNITGSTYYCNFTNFSTNGGGWVSPVWAICYVTNPNCGNGRRR